jgi:hypothetical protein
VSRLQAHLFAEGAQPDKKELVSKVKEFLVGKRVGLVKRALKTINNRLPSIINAKGCDASNAFDEEVGSDQEFFSDDEKEKEFK